MKQSNISALKHPNPKNERGSRQFPAHRKRLDKDVSERDMFVRRLYARVSKQIDCTQCANCCIEMGPRITQQDIRAISKHLGIDREKVISRYLKERKNKKGEYLAARIPCPFLKEKRCSIYEVRPKSCKSYPRVWKAGFISRIVGAIEDYSTCPIVFNVCKQFKMAP